MDLADRLGIPHKLVEFRLERTARPNRKIYRATLGPPPVDVAQVESDPKRQGKLTRTIGKFIHAPTAPRRRAPEAVDMMGLLTAVHALYGCLSRPMVEFLSRTVERFTGEVYSTASFYDDIYLDPKGRHHVKVCTGTTCHVNGAGKLVAACKKMLQVEPGETDADGEFTFFATACVGACSLAPVLMVDTDLYGTPDLDGLEAVLAPYRETGA